LVNNELKLTPKEVFVIRGFVTGLYWVTWTEPKRNLWTVVSSAENRRVHLLSAMQKQYRSDKRVGTERNNDKRKVIAVPIFCNRWLGASWIAGCIISLIQFLSLDNDNSLKRKIFRTLY